MPVTFQIRFDRPHAAYFAGETISGTVVMCVDKKKKRIRALSFYFRGEAHVRWGERATVHRAATTHNNARRSHSETVTYAARETYFDKHMYFLGSEHGEMEINPGEYSFEFECPLPGSLPSSFEGAYGHIRYTAKAVMHRPWKFDHGAKAAFTVISTCDLNAFPRAREPINLTQSTSVGCWWCRSGPLSMTVCLPAGGYVPGQVILVQIQIENSSSSPVEYVNCSFKKEVKWHANLTYGTSRTRAARTRTKTTQKKLASVRFQEVPPRSSKNFSQIITVPAVPPSNLDHCGIIDLQYFLKVVAETGSCASNLEARIPILIGTIPLSTTALETGLEQGCYLGPAAEQDPAAPAAPPYSPDLAPPSYEECVFKGNNIMDPEAGDDEYTMGIQDFTPRYPVYPGIPGYPPEYHGQQQEAAREADK